MTEYTILQYNPDTNSWDRIQGNVVAASAQRALATAGVGEGEFVAVPARSWKPITVRLDKITKMMFG